MTAGPSILRGLVWIQRSCILFRGNLTELVGPDTDVAQPRRQAEAGDQSADDICRRFAGPAEPR